MSKPSYKFTIPGKPVSLVRLPFQRNDKKVNKTMRSVPDTLRTAALQLMERVRVGLDIPSRAEVLDLAERISAITEKLDAMESRRSEDSKLVAQLRESATSASSDEVSGQQPKVSAKPKAKAAAVKPKSKTPAKPKAKAAAKAKAPTKPKAKAAAKPKAKPSAKSKATTAKPKAKAKAKAKAARKS